MSYARSASRAEADIDQGLRAYMLGVYNYMCAGLALSGAVALVVASSSLKDAFYVSGEHGIELTGLGFATMLAPLGMLLIALVGRSRHWSVGFTQAFYWAFTAIDGVSLSLYFTEYPVEALIRAFFITAAAFGALSLWGYTTKRDLTGLGIFCVMLMAGAIVAMLATILLGGTIDTGIFSTIGVLTVAGVTAYQTQNIKNTYFEAMDADDATRTAVWGALSLYVYAMAMFRHVLNLTGSRD